MVALDGPEGTITLWGVTVSGMIHVYDLVES